ncbi:MAG TPA: sigma-54 dependent transcriptional regulator [Verrucomicrobiota bacterium]|nr:sigma-54 dependent transcriptional regulator [Verrucomicrobiota bacterium]
MKRPLPPLLIVDDERNMRASLRTIMEGEGFEVEAAESAEQALQLLNQEEFFLVITDARLGGMSGYDLLKEIKSRRQNLPVLVITAYATPKLAVEAIKAGAEDYLAKPFAPEELVHAVQRCAREYQQRQEIAALRAKAGENYGLEQIIGESPKMRSLRQLIQTVAPTNATVLILGESGTGKELIAGALHTLSHRRERPYVRINCAAIPDTLLESELFGHEKGAFTGALRQKIGRVEEADGGTIFLDEIGDMSRPLQAKLLRFLEDGTFTRVGGNQELRVDVRLIAATNRDIVQAIRNDQFREDLFHRLNVVQFQPPPLRERGNDVLLLAEHFLALYSTSMNKHITGISPAAQRKLLAHHWPGNVRELRNVIERAVILETSNTIQPENLPDFIVENRLHKEPTIPGPGRISLDEMVDRYQRELILAALRENNNNLARTSEYLNISRNQLRYRMVSLGISMKDLSEDEPGPATRRSSP